MMGGRGGGGGTPRGPRVEAAPAADVAVSVAGPTQPLTDPVLAQRILDAIRAMNQARGREPGSLMYVHDLRSRIDNDFGPSRLDFDTALRQLSRRREISLVPASNQKTLTSDERQSGVLLGGEWKTIVSIS